MNGFRKSVYIRQTNGSAPFFPHFSLFRHLKFSQNFIWHLDRDRAGLRERLASDRWWQTQGERKRVRRGRRVEGWRGWETDGDSVLAFYPRGDKQPIWDPSPTDKEMEIKERQRKCPPFPDSCICTVGSAQYNNSLLLVTSTDQLCSNCIKTKIGKEWK